MLFGLLALAAVNTLSAQDDFRFGVGAAINPVTLYTASAGSDGVLTVPVQTAALFAPLQFGNHFRLEPQFGLVSTTVEKNTRDSDGNARGTLTYSQSGIMLGTGIFYTFTPDASTLGYIGARLGVILSGNSTEFNAVDGDKAHAKYNQTTMFYGPAFGGEYALSKFMSLGVELGLNFMSFGEVSYDAQPYIPDPNAPEVSQSAISTNALVFVRFYLN
jgi:hypothetical protein